MRTILILATALSGCGDDGTPDPMTPLTLDEAHELVPCDDSWIGRADNCERACTPRPMGTPAGTVCRSRFSEAVEPLRTYSNYCFPYFEAHGLRGCCVDDRAGHGEEALFAECEPLSPRNTVIACDPARIPAAAECETACAPAGQTASAPGCSGTNPLSSSTHSCSAAIVVDGKRGCCYLGGVDDGVMRWFECAD